MKVEEIERLIEFITKRTDRARQGEPCLLDSERSDPMKVTEGEC